MNRLLSICTVNVSYSNDRERSPTQSLALIGLIAFGFEIENVVRTGTYTPDTYFLPACGLFVAFWAVLVIETMKRKQNIKAMEWGVSDFKANEKERHEFEGIPRISHINGREELFFSPREKRKRIITSVVFVTILILIVIASIVGCFVVQHLCEDAGGFLKENAAVISGVLLAVQIQVFNVIYRYIAISLTTYENHRTNTEFEESLVFKVFIFNVCNSYASLAYIAFFKEEDRCIGSCMSELQSSLMSIFLVGLFVSNVLETGLPWIWNKIQECFTTPKGAGKLSKVENAFLVLDPYDMMTGPLDDYGELLIQFGYITLFVVAFPLAPILSLMTCWVEIRSDGYKMLRVCRRPEPLGAENIGPWAAVLSGMAKLGVITNAAILCFTSKFLSDDIGLDLQHRLYFFMAYLVFMYLALYIVDLAIPDMPTSVEVQRKRIDFIRRKAIERVSDKLIDDTRKKSISTFIMPKIWDEDIPAHKKGV